MGDTGDDFRAWKQASIDKRAANRDYGAKYLADMGVQFTASNDGAHLIVTRNGHTADFWPGTGKFKVRDGKWGRGILNLMRATDRTAMPVIERVQPTSGDGELGSGEQK